MNINYASLAEYSFGGNGVRSYVIALGAFAASLVVLKIFKSVVLTRLRSLTKKTNTDLDDTAVDILDSIGWPLYAPLALFFSFQFIIVPEAASKALKYFLIIVITFYLANIIQKIIRYGAEKISKQKQKEDSRFDDATIDMVSGLIRGLVWVLAAILLLQNMGYNISALVAGLGIGGIAVAFALQNILGDMLASISIYLDRPFQVGDFIIVDDDMGTVQKIGIKSTRIKTLQGEELILSNKELTERRIHNYKRMRKRRILFVFGVLYETSTEKLKKIPSLVKEAVESVEITEFDRAHFKTFGDFSLNFEVVYFINSNDYNMYMNTQQAINLKLKESFEKNGIDFAYPTQTVFVKK